MNQRQPRIQDKPHLRFVAELPCLVCKNNIESDAAHIRYADLSIGKRAVGVGEKPDDKWTVPLCRADHTKQHSMNEKEFWEAVRIDPLFIAQQLYAVSGNHEEGCKIIENAQIGYALHAMADG